MLDWSPSASQVTVIVFAFEHRFQRATVSRRPDRGPAQTWKTES